MAPLPIILLEVLAIIIRNVNAQSYGSYFYGDEAYELYENEYYCNDGKDCIINCFNFWACYQSTIYGPANASLTINCKSNFSPSDSNSNSCGYIEVRAETSTFLYIYVANGPFQSYSMLLFIHQQQIQ